jgi:hypothetical protein
MFNSSITSTWNGCPSGKPFSKHFVSMQLISFFAIITCIQTSFAVLQAKCSALQCRAALSFARPPTRRARQRARLVLAFADSSELMVNLSWAPMGVPCQIVLLAQMPPFVTSQVSGRCRPILQAEVAQQVGSPSD